MSRRRTIGWVVLVATLMLVVPWLVLALTRSGRPVSPTVLYFPDRFGGAVRLGGLRDGWQRHWRGRPTTTPENALRELLEATGEWQEMVEEYGEARAIARARLVPRILFETIGEESWLLFGEWDEPPAGEPVVGLVLLLPGGGSLQQAVGPLAELLLGDYRIQSTDIAGVRLYEYIDATDRRSLAFCNVGGRIVVSLRQRGLGPLPAIIARFSGEAEPPEVPSFDLERRFPPIFVHVDPTCLIATLRHYQEQRGDEPTPETLDALARWERRFVNIETLTLEQAGDPLLDLDLRIAWREGAPARFAEDAGDRLEHAGAIESANVPAIQADVRADLIRFVTEWFPLPVEEWSAGFAWEMFVPGVSATLRDALGLSGAGRVGLALYPSSLPLMARTLRWVDAIPLADHTDAPALHWQKLAYAGVSPGGGDRWGWLGPEAGNPLEAGAAWHAFTAHHWRLEPTPAAYIAVHFESFARVLDQVPALLLERGRRERLQDWREVAHGLALALGGAVLRLETGPEAWTVRLRTMGEAVSSN